MVVASCWLRNKHQGGPGMRGGVRVNATPPRRTVGVWSWLVGALFVLSLAATAWGGMFLSLEGIERVLDVNVALESQLVSVPARDRGGWWHAVEVLNKVAVSLPLFVVSHGGDRLTHYDGLARRGRVSPFNGGVLLHSHADVSRILQSEHQPRGRYLGAMLVPDRCLGADTLIFQVRWLPKTQQNHKTKRGWRQHNSHGGVRFCCDVVMLCFVMLCVVCCVLCCICWCWT